MEGEDGLPGRDPVVLLELGGADAVAVQLRAVQAAQVDDVEAVGPLLDGEMLPGDARVGHDEIVDLIPPDDHAVPVRDHELLVGQGPFDSPKKRHGILPHPRIYQDAPPRQAHDRALAPDIRRRDA